MHRSPCGSPPRSSTRSGWQEPISLLGHVYILLLEANLAVQALETGLALANDIGSAWWVGNITAYLARAYLLQGALPRAEAVLQAVMAR